MDPLGVLKLKKKNKKKKSLAFFSYLMIFFICLKPSCSEQENTQNGSVSKVDEIQVGVVVDMGSWKGKIESSCMSMAISDFYSLNGHYKTRLVLHTQDSNGTPLQALSAAINLMEDKNLQAIIGTETSMEAKILAELGDEAKVPIISFSAGSHSLSLAQHPFYVQITPDQTSQVQGIAALVNSFGWRDVVLIYEDSDDGRDFVSCMKTSFQDTETRVAYKIPIKPFSENQQIIEHLHMLMTWQATVCVVHMSPSLASLLFKSIKKLEMMTDGYVWIVTDWIINFLQTFDSSVLKSMQGVVGFKPYIPESEELQNFTSKWKRKFLVENPTVESMELNAYGVWAYDAVWALAKAVEIVRIQHPKSDEQATKFNMMDLATVRTSQSGSLVLKEILQSRFKGLSGEIGFINGKLISRGYEIVNVIGKSERTVGLWTPTTSASLNELEAIIWPGGSVNTPKGTITRASDKKLKIGVPIKEGFKEFVNVFHDPETNETIVEGFCIDVFDVVMTAFKVSYEFIPIESTGQTGTYYDDLILEVYNKNYDGVVGDVTITANRSALVDFTQPFTDLGVAMVVPIVNHHNMWIFLQPLGTKLWLTSAAFFFLIGFVVWLIEHPINEEFQGPVSRQIGIALWFSFSTLVFAHRERLVSNLSKFVVSIWVFVVLILTSSYTATLASMLTVQQIQSSPETKYIGYQTDSLLQQFMGNLSFRNSYLQTYTSVDDYAKALSRGVKNGGVSAIIDEIPYIKLFLAKYSSRFSMMDPKPTFGGFGFVFSKGSSLVSDISREILRLRETGKLQMMENEWFKGDQAFISDNIISNPMALSLDSFGGLFLLSGSSLILATLINLTIIFHEKLLLLVRGFSFKLQHIWGESELLRLN